MTLPCHQAPKFLLSCHMATFSYKVDYKLFPSWGAKTEDIREGKLSETCVLASFSPTVSGLSPSIGAGGS